MRKARIVAASQRCSILFPLQSAIQRRVLYASTAVWNKALLAQKISGFNMSQRRLVFCFFNPCFGCRSLAIMLVSLPGSKFVSQHITKIIVLLHLKESVCVFGIDFLFPAHGNKLSGATPCPALMCKLCAFPVMISFYSRPLLCFEQ